MTKEELVNKIIEHISKLSKLVQSIKLDIYINDNPAKKLDDALSETELIYALLFRLYKIYTDES